MSVFRVKLNQGNQGTLDINPATGVEFSTSVQRTMFVTGPNGKIREIADGTTFTDCNYWKQFAVPAVSVDDASSKLLLMMVAFTATLLAKIPIQQLLISPLLLARLLFLLAALSTLLAPLAILLPLCSLPMLVLLLLVTMQLFSLMVILALSLSLKLVALKCSTVAM